MSHQNTNHTNEYTGEVILIDKELRWTSFDVVKKIRNNLCHHYKVKKIKVGHAGTLDPLATGLIIVCTGKETKNIHLYQDSSKEYIATIKLGETTPSYDLESDVDKTFSIEHISKDNVLKVMKTFLGEQKQIPPVFSAKNLNGKRAYEYARKGKEIKLNPAMVTFFEIELLSFEKPFLKLRIVCSKGTYIRAFARDFGEALESGAYLSDLRRTKIGKYSVEDAISIDTFENNLRKNETF